MHAQSTWDNKFTIFLQYSKKNTKDEVEFCLLIIIKSFFKVMYVCMYAQITQNKKFSISLRYLKKEVNHKVDLLHAGRNENLRQIDIIILMGMVKHFQSSRNS